MWLCLMNIHTKMKVIGNFAKYDDIQIEVFKMSVVQATIAPVIVGTLEARQPNLKSDRTLQYSLGSDRLKSLRSLTLQTFLE